MILLKYTTHDDFRNVIFDYMLDILKYIIKKTIDILNDVSEKTLDILKVIFLYCEIFV